MEYVDRSRLVRRPGARGAGRSVWAWLFAGATVLAVLGAGCNQGAEGDRCNPDLAAGESDCNGGLKCTQPVNCPENYCCPVSGPSSSPFCQPGCAGGLASICAAEPTYDACAPASHDAAPLEAAAEASEGAAPEAGRDGGGE